MRENFKRKEINLNNSQLNDYMLEIITDLNKIGFDKKIIQKVITSYRIKIFNSKNNAGRCDYKNKIISISNCSNNLQSNDINIAKEIKNTLMHEFLHAMYPNSGHTGNWKAAANIINYSSVNHKYGIIKRCYDIDNKTREMIVKTTKYKYQAVCSCSDCNGVYNFMRKTHHMNFRNNTTNYLCPKCGEIMKLKVL